MRRKKKGKQIYNSCYVARVCESSKLCVFTAFDFEGIADFLWELDWLIIGRGVCENTFSCKFLVFWNSNLLNARLSLRQDLGLVHKAVEFRMNFKMMNFKIKILN